MTMNVVGVDPGTKLLGFVALTSTGKKAWGETLSLGKGTYQPSKLDVVYERFGQFLGTLPGQTTAVFIEDPVVGRGGVRATVVQAYVNGVLQLVATQHGFPLWVVNNQSWKLEVAGVGNASKGDVATSIRDIWVTNYPGLATVTGLSTGTAPEDLSDAAGLAIYGLRTLRRGVRLGRPRSVQRRR